VSFLFSEHKPANMFGTIISSIAPARETVESFGFG
jgi:hypothetical protein